MVERFEIKGGAGEFEAGVVAIVLDHLKGEEEAARSAVPRVTNDIPAWVRAMPQTAPGQPVPLVTPDRR
jgi:hypothetical protein